MHTTHRLDKKNTTACLFSPSTFIVKCIYTMYNHFCLFVYVTYNVFTFHLNQ
ncbi:hypothetical protein Hanom_Chr13g01243981 [Helianthus anomalus]